jgi:NAD(P)-dependent dehydrogenase (short-subunit alcohol dehydrogenase family)
VYPAPGVSLKGQTGIVIGANAGLGLESASKLIDLGLSKLIVTTRSETKAEATVHALKARHPNSDTQVDFLIVDLSSYDSIQDFVNLCQQLPRIDFVILNAGMTSESHRLTKSTGHEELIQINYLSPMLLATLMLPVLKAKAPTGRPGRITVVNSGTAMHAKFPQHTEPSLLAALDSKDNYKNNATAANQYSLSKFLCHLYFDRLYQYVSADDVVINLVDPGLTKGTELHRNINGALASHVLGGMKAMIGRTLEVGASTYIHAAITMGKQSHGSYIMNWRTYPCVDPFSIEHSHQLLTLSPGMANSTITRTGKTSSKNCGTRPWRSLSLPIWRAF